MTTATRLTGDAMLERIQVVIENANVLHIEATATAKAEACGYTKEDGKADYVAFYTALLEAKGLLNQTDDDEEVGELRAELNERYGEDAVDAFCEIWGEDDLEGFEDAYCGEYESGAAYAEELVTDCYGVGNLPSFVEVDWRATWDNLSYDYYFENGFIFNANW